MCVFYIPLCTEHAYACDIMEVTISYYLAGLSIILLALPPGMYVVRFKLLLLFKLYISGTDQNPHLNSSIPTGSHVFRGQEITIICTVDNSNLLAWRSKAYIDGGPNAQVSVTSDGRISGTVNSGFVRFIGTNDEGQNLLQISSEFRMIVLPDYKAFTITCQNTDLGFEANITFQLYGRYILYRDLLLLATTKS